MKHIKFLIYVFIFIGVLVLIIQNHQAFNTKVVFNVDLWFAKYESTEISIYIISVAAFTLGLIVSWVYNLFDRIQLIRKIGKLNNQIKQKDKELNSLRNLPLVSESVSPSVHEDDVEFS